MNAKQLKEQEAEECLSREVRECERYNERKRIKKPHYAGIPRSFF